MPVSYLILGAIYGFVIDCGLPSINEFGNIYAHADDFEDKQRTSGPEFETTQPIAVRGVPYRSLCCESFWIALSRVELCACVYVGL